MTHFLLLAQATAAPETTGTTPGVIIVWVPILMSCVIICMLLVSLRKAVRKLQNLERQSFEQLRIHGESYGKMLEALHQQTDLLREVSAKLGEDFDPPVEETVLPKIKPSIPQY